MEEVRSLTVPQSIVANPNPFTAATTIRCSAPPAAQTPARLYDAAGSLVRTLPAGGSRVLSGAGLRPGIYVLRAEGQSARLVKVGR